MPELPAEPGEDEVEGRVVLRLVDQPEDVTKPAVADDVVREQLVAKDAFGDPWNP